jgi:Trypsin-co-occurring domain 1
MAGRVMPIRVDDVDLLIEATPVVGSEPTSSLDRAQENVAEAFDRAQSAIVAVAGSTVDVIRRMGARSVEPDQVEVKFGLKFSVQGNVILAAAAGEASLEVTLTYHADPTRRGARGGTTDGA